MDELSIRKEHIEILKKIINTLSDNIEIIESLVVVRSVYPDAKDENQNCEILTSYAGGRTTAIGLLEISKALLTEETLNNK